MLKKNILLSYMFPLSAMIYLASMNYLPYSGSPFVKALPILILAATVFYFYFNKDYNSLSHFLFGIGLVFSAGGDIALAVDFKNSFVYGLSLFLIAHLFYIVAFYNLSYVRWRKRLNILIFVVGMGICMAFVVLPLTKSLLIPVMVYLIVITIMATFAVLQEFNAFIIGLGAIIFMLSDSLIAINKFVTPVPYASLWIMTTYYIAQGLLAKGMLNTIPIARKK